MLALALKYLKLIKFIILIVYDIQFNNEREDPQHSRITPVHTCAAFLYIVWSVPSILFVFMFLYNCDIVVVVQLLSSVWFFETHRLQNGRLHCPLLSPRVCSNSWLLSQWCHPTVSSSAVPFCSCPQTFPASWPFPKSGLFTPMVKILELQLQYQLFQWIFRTVFL